MSTNQPLGWFGKLPCAGDFLTQGLPTDVSTQIDHWINGNLLWMDNNQADWVQLYLQTTASGFFIQNACINIQGRTWGAVGLLMPSVDSVGRLYPFVIFKGIEYSVLAEEDCFQSEFKALWVACSNALELNWSTGQLADAINQGTSHQKNLPNSGSWNAPAVLKGPVIWFDLNPEYLQTLSTKPIPDCYGWPQGPEFLALLSPSKGQE